MPHTAAHEHSRGPADPEQQFHSVHSDRQRHIAYLVLGGIFVLLLIVAVGVFRQAKTSVRANQLADTLIANLNQAGLPIPSKDQVVRTLGDDGGALCADPGSALRQGFQRLSQSNGAGGPGIRPVFAAQQMVQAEEVVIQTYCPEELADYQEHVNQLRYSNVIKE